MNKVLVVIDMQNDFVTGSLGTKEAVAIVEKVVSEVKEARQNQIPIIFTRDTHQENYLDTAEGKKLPVKHCIVNTDGWNLISQLEVKPEDEILDKPNFGSALLPELIAKHIRVNTEIELIGLCTDICVVTNALILKTLYPENEITVKAYACAGVTGDSHKAALETMKMCQINIVE
jgi:nicotinamidase-related amidase